MIKSGPAVFLTNKSAFSAHLQEAAEAFLQPRFGPCFLFWLPSEVRVSDHSLLSCCLVHTLVET